MKPVIKKYKCQLCLRHTFDRPSPHKCVGGFRKRKIIWHLYYFPEKVVMFEKTSAKNVYKNIMRDILQKYSQISYPMKKNENI